MSAGTCVLANSGEAHAFSDSTFFGKYPDELLGGGGGRYFTGSPADGYTCAVCHTAPSTYSFPLTQTGLPVDGYVPDRTYTVKLAWPEAAAFARTNARPLTSLMAEFVAEDGGNAGTVTLPLAALIKPTEVCSMIRPGSEFADLASSIYQVARGEDPVRFTNESMSCETGGDDEKRCIIAVEPCGSSEVQVKWKAPPQWRGPIWFSTSFVASNTAAGYPNDNDFVTELSIPINAAKDGATYETTLESGCSVSLRALGAGGRRRAGSMNGVWFMLGVVACVVGWRRKTLVAVLTGAGLSASACADSNTKIYEGSSTSASIGLFEPDERRDSGSDGPKYMCMQEPLPDPNGAAAPTAGKPADAAAGKPAAAGGAGVAGVIGAASALTAAGSVAAGTSAALAGTGAGGVPAAGTLAVGGAAAPVAGTPAPAAGTAAPPPAAGGATGGILTITFTTTPPAGVAPGASHWDKNGTTPSYGIVWIEDTMGRYVKTVESWAGQYAAGNLKTYLTRRAFCPDDTTDVVTTGTIAMHRQHMLTWKLNAAPGFTVPNGTYRLWMEVQVAEDNVMAPVSVDFELNGQAWTRDYPAMPPHAGINLNFTPNK